MKNSAHSAADTFVDQAFLGEIEIEAGHCLASAVDVDRTLREEDVGSTFRALHGLLVHAGMISKLLWPGKIDDKAQATRMRKRAERIRSSLALSREASSALSDRDLRNALEHFDQKLDTWAAQQPRGLVDRVIGPPSALANFDAAIKLRHYDPGTHTYYFRDNAFDIQAIVSAAREVRERVPAARVAIRAV